MFDSRGPPTSPFINFVMLSYGQTVSACLIIVTVCSLLY